MSGSPLLAAASVLPATTPSRLRRGWAASVPAWAELAATAAVVAVLLPYFHAAAGLGAGRDARFLDRGAVVAGLPDAALPDACRAVGAQADVLVREALCRRRELSSPAAAPLTSLPSALVAKIERVTQAFAAPLRDFEARRDVLVRDAASGATALRENGDAVAALEDDVAPFIARYRLAAGGGPVPLRCATQSVERRFVAPAGAVSTTDAAARANATLLLAAAVDGRPSIRGIADEARLGNDAAAAPGCQGIVDSLAASALLMADARQAETRVRKNDAMRALAGAAGLQWAVAIGLGLVFLRWSRSIARPALGAGVALMAWAAVAWLGRVPWPFAGAGAFVQGRADAGLVAMPATFVVATALLGLGVVATALSRRPDGIAAIAPVPQAMSSRLGYAGFAAATGIGALLLLDLSFDGHPGNRYLALYHQGHLWLAMTLLSVLLFARRQLAAGLAWALSIGAEANARASRRLGGGGAAALLAVLAVAGVLVVAFALANTRQLTSELGRIWLIGGAAWFFFLRAGPMTEQLARSGPAGGSFLRYAWPLLFVVGVLVAVMFATHDMGPLLIAGYASGAFVAATAAMWWHHRSGRVVTSFAAAITLFAAWIAAVTWALFRVGAYDGVTASRLESVAAPFASVNDQLALVSWFQQAAPAGGFGIGSVPWCGFSAARCSGVPAQIHSDYTFTAMVGVFGPLAAWAVSIGAAFWLHRLIRHHGRVTRGEPRLVRSGGGRLAIDGQALISWIAVAWVVLATTQLAVTVAGNLAVLPLTGVTFPFVSFGMTSLLVNVAFLSLCLNVDVPRGGSGG
ncbi:MAG: FtsW/RodA/SpoVE family cell cycle protein [Caldimonas sp.]